MRRTAEARAAAEGARPAAPARPSSTRPSTARPSTARPAEGAAGAGAARAAAASALGAPAEEEPEAAEWAWSGDRLEVAALRHRARRLVAATLSRWQRLTKLGRLARLRAGTLRAQVERRSQQALLVRAFGAWSWDSQANSARAARCFLSRHGPVVIAAWHQAARARRTVRVALARAARQYDERLLLRSVGAWRALPRGRALAVCAAREARASALLRARRLRAGLGALGSFARTALRRRRGQLLATYFRWAVLVRGAIRAWVARASARLRAVALGRRRRGHRVLAALAEAAVEGGLARARYSLALRHRARTLARAALVAMAGHAGARARARQRARARVQARQQAALRVLRASARREAARRRAAAALAAAARLRALRRACGVWRARARACAEARVAATAALRHRSRALQRGAWAALRGEWLAGAARRKHVMGRARALALRRALRRLRANAEAVARERRAALAAVAHARGRAARAALAALALWAARRRAARALEQRSVLAGMRPVLRSALRAWQARAAASAQRARRGRQLAAKARLALLRAATRAWRERAQRGARRAALAQHAVTWRRERLLQAASRAWLHTALGRGALRQEAQQRAAAQNAARAAAAAARAARHWRALVLRRRASRATQRRAPRPNATAIAAAAAATASTTAADPTAAAAAAAAPTWTYEARTQVRSAMSLGWLEQLEPGRSRVRLPPRKPIDLVLEELDRAAPGPAEPARLAPQQPPAAATPQGQVLQPRDQSPLSVRDLDARRPRLPSQAVSLPQSPLSVRDVDARRPRLPSQAVSLPDSAADLSEEAIRQRLAEFADLKRQVRLDRQEREQVRAQLRALHSSSAQDPLLATRVARYADRIDEMDARKRLYAAKKHEALALVRSMLA
jgi:hypothetical protein